MKNSPLTSLLNKALSEDAPNGDITTQLLGDASHEVTATLLAKQNGIFYGEEIITTLASIQAFTIDTKSHPLKNGMPLTKGQTVCKLTGPFSTLLTTERVLLNFLQHLSGVATLTNEFVTTLNDSTIKILDTRKTTPLLRDLEKNAVKAGGGTNHRWNLSDMILLKENHLSILEKQNKLDDLSNRIKAQKEKNPTLKAEIEIESYEQLITTDFSQIDYILLDNFKLETLEESTNWIRQNAAHCEIEVSGNISLKTIASYKNKDIDRISVGAITHSPPAFDFSLLF
ncbi:carboxylating nicotinate-nucleotide diphosphorylase [bacterium]|nr:carboxylating nicotinate-nucleotide diphosphorylase [bacterium]